MRRLFLGIFAAIGVVAVLFVVAAAVAIIRLRPVAPSLPGNIVLSADLTRGLADGPGENDWRRLVLGGGPRLRDFLDALEAGASDARVKGIIARVGNDDMGLAEIQEVRDAIAAFRARGKFAIAFADSFGEFGAGTRPYYLATAFDQIWLQPMGSLGITGLYSEATFFKGTLDLLGIAPQFAHRGRYKTAANILTETKMTEPQREEINDLLNSISAQIVSGIARARKLPPAAVRDAIDHAPLLPDEALQAKLVDRLDYRDAVIAAAHRRAGSDAELVNLRTYLDGAGRPNRKGEKIALIYASGLIVRGDGSDNPLAGSKETAANDLTRAFRAAVRDPKVRAILFRIDSPGGSVVASETIWHDVVFARERGKPVIVSMGDVAGSGGYYVAAPADKIVAEPATLTGSIGVLAGKLVLADLLKKIGVTTDATQFGANAAMFSTASGFSALAGARLQAFLDAAYQGFKERVASGRRMTPDEVEAVAKGRVWSGEEAKANGLVDMLGGYEAALRLARQAAGIAPGAPVQVTVFPQKKGVAEFLYDRLTGSRPGDDDIGVTALGHALEVAQPLLQRLEALIDDDAMLTMPLIGEPR